jgi:hypothetical protein
MLALALSDILVFLLLAVKMFVWFHPVWPLTSFREFFGGSQVIADVCYQTGDGIRCEGKLL